MKNDASKEQKGEQGSEPRPAKAKEAVEQKNRQVEELSRKLEYLTRQFNEQAKLAALSASSAAPDQQQVNQGMKTAVRKKLEAEALGQGVLKPLPKNVT